MNDYNYSTPPPEGAFTFLHAGQNSKLQAKRRKETSSSFFLPVHDDDGVYRMTTMMETLWLVCWFWLEVRVSELVIPHSPALVELPIA